MTTLIHSSRLPGHLPSNCKVPGSIPSCVCGFLQLWQETVLSHPAIKPEQYCVLCDQGTAEKQLHAVADVIIPVGQRV